MASRSLRPLLRRWAPARAGVARAHVPVAVCGGAQHIAGGFGACWSSCVSAIDTNDPGTCAALKFSAPRTTYEGNCDQESLLQELNVCRNGFSRSNFVKERRCAEELRNKYKIGELLGQGATAKVYRAENKRTGQAVAVKVICKDNVSNQQMLQNEIKIHKATDHPNLLRLFETFEDDCRHFLVLELCEGGDLWRHLTSNSSEYDPLTMSEDDALQLFRQVVKSVMYLHSRGIAHRDLKPGNFLFRTSPNKDGKEKRSGVIKLTDFGVSAYCPGRHRLTKTVGTERFMAPEIIRNQPYTEKADIFSMGCILHMLLTGHPPKQKEDGTYAISTIRLQFVSDQVRDLIGHLMQTRPEDRPSAEAIAKLPILQSSRHRLRAKSVRLNARFLDQMYAYSAYPLLKKAAMVAMVSRAENDSDFMASIEKFMSLDSCMTSSITVDDLHEALFQELSNTQQSAQKNGNGRQRRDARVGRMLGCFNQWRRQRHNHQKATVRGQAQFVEGLRGEMEQLVHKIDMSGSGQINYSEWLAATVEPSWYTDPLRIAAAFRLFDFDGDGMISASDLKEVIPDVFNELTVDTVLQESQLSAKQTSWITQEHFALLITSGNPSPADGVEASGSALPATESS